MALPPTAAKFSTDVNNVTTFFFAFPNFTGSHSGVTASLGVNSVAGGGTGLATLTANNVILGNGTSSPTFVAPGTAGNVLLSNGTTWTSSTLSGSSSFVVYTSSQVTTDSSTVSSASFVTFSNSPAFTFTPTITGTYKVYTSIPVAIVGTNAVAVVRVFNTTGGATLLSESQATSTIQGSGSLFDQVFMQSVFTLTAGTSYVFDIQGKQTVGTSFYVPGGTGAPFYMYAEGVALTSPAVATPHSIRYFSSTTTISSSLATIVYATKDYDADSAYSSGTYTVQSGGDGKYQVNASLLIAGTISLNNTAIMEIQKNGIVISRKTVYLAAALTDGSLLISDSINCVATDTLRIQVSTSAVGPTIVSSNFDNYLSICRVSA